MYSFAAKAHNLYPMPWHRQGTQSVSIFLDKLVPPSLAHVMHIGILSLGIVPIPYKICIGLQIALESGIRVT